MVRAGRGVARTYHGAVPTEPTDEKDTGAGPVPQDIAGLTYEQARDELVTIVARLEAGQVGLEDSLALWQRGEALAAHCSRWLDGAEAQLSDGGS